jgi:hypothetical protein
MYHHELEPASEPEPQPKPEPQPERESVTVELDDLPVTEAQTQPGGEISPEWTEPIDDPVAVLFEAFKRRVADMPSPKFLELGVTSQSAVDHRGWLPADCRYVGVDIAEHPDVDVVVDPHVMSEALPARYFDAAVSLISFSDLAMPWVVAVELNRVLRPGAYVYVAARHTWPLTEAGGFFRFTEHSWASLFNPFSGFEICGVASGEPARVVADVTSAVTVGLENYPAFLTSAVLARKIGETELRWDVPAADVLSARGRPNSER